MTIKETAIQLLAPLFRNRVYTARNGIARGLKRKGGLGFLPRRERFDGNEHFLHSLDLAGKVVYDIGAHIGLYTIFFASRVGAGGKVVAFEPNPANAKELRENVAVNDFAQVECVEIAFGSEPGTAEFAFVPVQSSKTSMVPHWKEEMGQDGHARIFTASIDTLDRRIAHLPKPDFLKVDVEGAEAMVLGGAPETLRAHGPDVFMEVHEQGTPFGDANEKEIDATLRAAGYRLHRVVRGALAGEIRAGEPFACEALFAQKIR